jgi:hypothetical protein
VLERGSQLNQAKNIAISIRYGGRGVLLTASIFNDLTVNDPTFPPIAPQPNSTPNLGAVMLAARQATDVLHHLSDFVLKERSPPLIFANIEDVRSAVECKMLLLTNSQAGC